MSTFVWVCAILLNSSPSKASNRQSPHSYNQPYPVDQQGIVFNRRYPSWSPSQPLQTSLYDGESCPKFGKLITNCRPAKDCAVWYNLTVITFGASCRLSSDDSLRLCCPDIPHNNRGTPLVATKKAVSLYRDIDIYSINAAAHAARFNLRLMDETEKTLIQRNVTVRRNSSQYVHLLFFQTTDNAKTKGRSALLAVETARELGKRFQLNADEAGVGLSQLSVLPTILNATCPPTPSCDKTALSPFRTNDGSCNNLRHPSWGQSQTPMQRITPPLYVDGVWQPRDGQQLPSARLVSISVVPNIDSPHKTNTLWVMQYGQFIDHDLANTPVFLMNDGRGITCCSEDGQFIKDTDLVHPECLPIEIPDDDPFFARHGQRCMNFVRSTPAPRHDCKLGHAEQMNQLTSFLDNSNVYGSTPKQEFQLRSFKGGLLKVGPTVSLDELPLLPPDHETDTDCRLSKNVSAFDPPAHVKCFKAGDARVDEQPNLAVTHTIFMRQHNNLAAQLAELNPHWDDERLYQEARRILIAQMQHITYNEWLPVVLGREAMQIMGLLPLGYGFSRDYDEMLNPSIVNEFATAAYRFGHSLIPGQTHLYGRNKKKETDVVLRQHFFKSQILYTPGHLDKFLVGLATQPMQSMDHYFSEELTNHLFQEDGKPFGMDLVSLNIQRGRDHGLQGYNFYRSLCGLPRAKHFNDLTDVVPLPIVERFQLLYANVDDIDLFIGGVSEKPVAGALVGPTFQCIIADQFLRLKRGDRFFYDLAGQVGSFTEGQLNEIRQSSFARIICDNSLVGESQPLAFKSVSVTNPLVDCSSSSIPRVSLKPWQYNKAPIPSPRHDTF